MITASRLAMTITFNHSQLQLRHCGSLTTHTWGCIDAWSGEGPLVGRLSCPFHVTEIFSVAPRSHLHVTVATQQAMALTGKLNQVRVTYGFQHLIELGACLFQYVKTFPGRLGRRDHLDPVATMAAKTKSYRVLRT